MEKTVAVRANSSTPLRPGEGWTIEYAYHYGYDNDNAGGRRRLLAVVSGIQFLVHSNGQAGRFNIIDFTMKCGSGMALFGSATIVCDLILFYLVRDRDRYRKAVCSDEPVKASSRTKKKLEALRMMSKRARRELSISTESDDQAKRTSTAKKKTLMTKRGSFENEGEHNQLADWGHRRFQIRNPDFAKLAQQHPAEPALSPEDVAFNNRY
ncbi:purinergic receptor P2X, ligand-gated ion channel [Cichlidogyrus casuarinus]|uniref:Purinergic receptor P2X, ligand-gated ion channel n=1 Tax=Cichlidogyrus casuarinus TaxID=1844966 RepID=A0ABD2PT79_9PLAT